MLVCVKDAGLRPRRFAAPAGSLTQPVRGGLAEVSGRGMSFLCCALPLAGRTGNIFYWVLGLGGRVFTVQGVFPLHLAANSCIIIS
jgi:hypothetical protein